MKHIISIKELSGEVTIEYKDEVIIVNNICMSCILHITDYTKKNLSGYNICLNKDKCDLCKNDYPSTDIYNIL